MMTTFCHLLQWLLIHTALFAAAQGLIPLARGQEQDLLEARRRSSIKSDEQVIFFPTAASLSDNGQTWQVPIHGWIFELEEHDLLRRAALDRLQATLGIERDDQIAMLRARGGLLLADNERGKTLQVRIGPHLFTLPPSASDGHMQQTIQLSAAQVAQFSRDGKLSFQAVTRVGDPRQFRGSVLLLPPHGVSVISDIDDTIKVTEAYDPASAIRNTLLEPFQPVAGMAGRYQGWAREGAAFHMVTASPWQLYPPLSEFCREHDFPEATWHMNRVRFKDATVLKLLGDPMTTKLALIERLLEDFPQRQFILVGDSGQRDPELYARLARVFPERILKIFIRDLAIGDPAAAQQRYTDAFAGLDADLWQVFTRPEVLPTIADMKKQTK